VACAAPSKDLLRLRLRRRLRLRLRV